MNGAYEEDCTDIGKLMHDFRCKNPENMNFKQLADRTSYFKRTNEGEQAMCKMMEDMRKVEAEKTLRNINKLNAILIAAKRFADLERTTKDTAYQAQLLKELVVEM